MKRIMNFLFGADLWRSRLGVMLLVTWLSLMWYVVDWCAFTTFRAMSDWMLYVSNILAAMLLTLPFLLSRRMWLQIAVVVLTDALLVANIMYCRTYFTDIPLESFALAGNLSDFTASIYSSLNILDIGFVVILVVGVVWAGRVVPDKAHRRVMRYVSCTALLAVIFGCGLMTRGGFYKEYDRLKESCYFSTCGSPTYTFAGHVAYSLMDCSRNSSAEMAPAVEAWLADHKSLMPSPGLPDSIRPRKNLVIILCESLESWLIGKEIDGKPITPFLNSLVADSTTLFAPDMLTQVGPGRSIDCQLMITAGLLPMNGSVYSMKFPQSTYLTLNKALREDRGTRSTILTCDKPITWNQEVISRSFGYDTLIDRRAWVIDELVGNPGKLSDGSFFRQAVDKLKSGEIWPEGEPGMLTFVTYSGHNPFRLPDALKDPDFDVSGSKLTPPVLDYITINHYVDSQLRTIVDYLRSRSDWDETLVVITGDHEGLASWRSEIRSSSPAAAELVDERQLTPFIVLNSPVGGRHDGIVGQIDMYPTLLDLLGLNDYEWRGLGQSILAPDYHATAISSMTLQHLGDTTALSPELLDHLRKARGVSDAIIRYDLLNE